MPSQLIIPGENAHLVTADLLFEIFAMQKTQTIMLINRQKTYTPEEVSNMINKFKSEKFEEMFEKYGTTPDLLQTDGNG